VNGNNYANTAVATGKFIINGGNTVANAAVMTGLPNASLAMFNDAGNCYINLTPTGNIDFQFPNAHYARFLQTTLIESASFVQRGAGPNSNNAWGASGFASDVESIFTASLQVPRYTIANKPTTGRFMGQIIAITDATPAGRLAFYDATNARWSYVNDNSAV
jgi:hypothetical protein